MEIKDLNSLYNTLRCYIKDYDFFYSDSRFWLSEGVALIKGNPYKNFFVLSYKDSTKIRKELKVITDSLYHRTDVDLALYLINRIQKEYDYNFINVASAEYTCNDILEEYLLYSSEFMKKRISYGYYKRVLRFLEFLQYA
jgi:hypothetical protein